VDSLTTALEAPPPPREHLSGYQRRDFEIVDYQMYQLGRTGLQFRGPALDERSPGEYFTCIGAAQTFGCFCERPFPVLLSATLGRAALNLGYGGAGPEFFARHPELLEYVNRGRFAIVQVMSGRSQSNSLFDCGGLEYLTRRSDGKRLGANAAYEQLLQGPDGVRRLRPRVVTRRLARALAAPRVRRIVEETRASWIDSYRRLLGAIRVPKVLFWFATREPEYVEGYGSVGALFGEFPQLVNAGMVAEVRGMCDGYVACVTRRGSPQRLASRFTGRPVTVDPSLDRPDLRGSRPWTHNRYYPSPQMHEDAASALSATCRLLLK
jgi:hypothetical protein